MTNVLKTEKKLTVLHHLVEGNSIRATERLTGVHRDTIMRLMVQAGNKCRDFLDATLRNLTPRHIEVDEIWTFVAKKRGQLHVDERDNPYIGDIYLWTAVDQDTKLIASFALGKRTGDWARRFLVDLASRIKLPAPNDLDSYAPTIQLSSDAFPAYPEAVDLAFGPYIQYGQIVKNFRNVDQPGRYAPPEIIAAERKPIFGNVNPFTICTSHVERNNLTIRTFMRRFTRLSLGFSKKLENLAAAVSLFVAYYNFCWRTRYPDDSGMPGKRRPPAAMLAGITDYVWKFNELYSKIISN